MEKTIKRDGVRWVWQMNVPGDQIKRHNGEGLEIPFLSAEGATKILPKAIADIPAGVEDMSRAEILESQQAGGRAIPSRSLWEGRGYKGIYIPEEDTAKPSDPALS